MSQAVSFIVCPTFSFLTLFAPAGALRKHFSFLSLQRGAKGAGPFKGDVWRRRKAQSALASIAFAYLPLGLWSTWHKLP